jgi:hypothetical protein
MMVSPKRARKGHFSAFGIGSLDTEKLRSAWRFTCTVSVEELRPWVDISTGLGPTEIDDAVNGSQDFVSPVQTGRKKGR